MKVSHLVLATALVSFPVLTGCLKTGTATERTPLTRSLAAYRTASIEVVVAPDIENPDVYRSQLTTFLEESLKEKSLFSELPASGGELTLRITIKTLEKPTVLAGMPVGETNMTGSVDLVDGKTKGPIGAFDITARSKKKVKTSFNGVDTSVGEDPRKRAMLAAAEQVSQLIEEHRGGAASAPAPPSGGTVASSAPAALPPSAPPPATTGTPSAPPPATAATPIAPPGMVLITPPPAPTGTPSAPPPAPAAPPGGPPGRLSIQATPLPASVRVAGRSQCSLLCVSLAGAALTDADKRQIENQLGKHLGAMRGCLAGQQKSGSAIVLPFGPQGSGQLQYDFGPRSDASAQCRASLPAVAVSGPPATTWKCTDYCD